MNTKINKEIIMSSRNFLREKAKKIYKEQAKSVPKNKRITFAQFFKQFKGQHSSHEEVIPADDDFDFDDMISVNNISDPESTEEE